MDKQGFLDALARRLSGLPRQELEERLAFYGEMIDDRVEEGVSEAEAVAAVGDVEQIADQILWETPLHKIVRENVHVKRTMRPWEILLLALGFPLWFPLLMAAFAVTISLCAVIFSVVVALWAVFLALAVCFPACLVAGIATAVTGFTGTGLAIGAAGLVCAGLSIFLFLGCKALSKGLIALVRHLLLAVKHGFIGRERVK